MAKCEWAILCDYAFQDVGRKICLIGAFDNIYAKQVPATHRQAALAMKIMGEPSERVRIRVEIRRPSGAMLAKLEGGGELGNSGTADMQLNIAGMPLPDFGVYAVQIFVNDELSKEIAFKVLETPQPVTSGETIN